MLPASIQVCPVEIPGRGRREGEPVSDVKELARLLARSLPLRWGTAPLSSSQRLCRGRCWGA